MRRLILLSLLAALACARYVDNVREKRDIEAHDWLTEAQKSELKALKESADGASLKKRTMELYELLPAAEKEKWNGKYKEMCVAWIKEVATEEETENYKKWKAEGKMEEITSQYKKLKERLSEHKRKDVELWENECWSLWKDEFPASRGRRSVMDLAEEKLAFLGAEKIAELKALKESGANDDVIRDKVVSWTLEHWKSSDSKVSTADFVKKCYGWIKDVTQAEEYAAFEKLHHTDHEACRAKVKEFLARLPAEKQSQVEKSLPLCDAIWYKQHQEEHGAHEHEHHAHKHHVKRHLNTMHIEKYMGWLSQEQKDEIKKMEAGGESYETLLAKMKGWYDALESRKKSEVREDFKDKCAGWVFAKTTETEQYDLQEFIQMGDKDGLLEYLKKIYARLTDDEKHEVDHTKDMCIAVWTTAPERKRRDHHHHEEYKEYFTWLTPEQAAEVKTLRDAEKHDEAYAKTNEFYGALAGDKKTEATEKLKGACKHFFKNSFGEAAVEEIKNMKESGSSMDEIGKKVEEFIGKITDEKNKAAANRVSINCKKIFSASRKRRDQHDEYAAYKEYFTWLTPDQAAEIRKLKEAKDEDGINTKIHEFYNALAGDKKTEAAEKLKGACKHFFKDTFGEAAVAEYKAMKESGSSHDDIAKKVEEYIGKITDEKKKTLATKASVNCKKYFSASRKRRDHHHHEEYKEYFSWLTPEQGAEVKSLRDAGKHEEVYTKVMEYYDSISGDKKPDATEKLKGACKHFFKDTFGEAALEEIKNMKESGSSMDDIAKKVEEFIGKVTDEKKKEVATRASVNCKKVFSASRRRRDQPDQHEEYKPYFTWLTAEQGAEIKALRDAEKHDEAYAKTNEFYGALEGDKKTEATEKLKGACKHFFKSSFGDAAVEEIKNMKESGSSMDDITKKVDEFIGKVTDDEKKAAAMRVTANCKKVFSASRRRRDHHDEYAAYKEYFTWLTPDQVAEVKKLREAGDEDGANKKVHEFYDALTGDKKTEATEKLKGACKHFFKDTFGEAAVEEFKAMKESGSSVEDITKKVEELVGKITDEKKKATATKATVNCKKMFSASRKRREHQDEYAAYHQYFTWLTPDQAAEVKKLKEAGDDEGINTKVHEYYAALSGDKKTEATEKLKGSCRHYFKDTFGEAAVEEFKAFKESGTSVEDIAKKVDELVGKITDEKKQVVAARAAVNCKKLFGASRKRREHNHNIDEAMTEFLPWLSDEQKAELKGLKESGAEEKIGEKIMEYFDSVDASKKDEARTKLQAGCKHFLKHLIGDAAAEEMKALKETGATDIDMAKKLEEIISKMPEGVDKTKAIGMSKNCKKVYGVASRKRRHEHSLEEGFTEFLPWITDDQKMELKNMKEAGAEEKMGDKIMEYFDSVDASKKDEARSKLQAGCRHYLKDLLGDVVAGEMKQMHEAGSSPAEMAKKLDQIIGNMDDGEKKAKATRLSKNCRKVYGVEARKRRNTYGEYDERYQKYYNWLKDEQRDELAELQDSGEDDVLLDKISQYFKDLEEAKKEEARGQLKMGCRMRMRDLLGEERSEEIRRMKDEGATKGKMLDKVAQFVEAMEEGTEKERARRSYRHCAKILGRQRREAEKPFNLAEHTAWLKPEQRNELNSIIRSQQLSSDDIYGKLFEYLNELEEDEKVAATMKMRAACRYWRESFIGRSQSEKLKQMKQTGKKWSDIEHTMDGMIAAIEDASVRSKAQAAIGACKHLWINR